MPAKEGPRRQHDQAREQKPKSDAIHRDRQLLSDKSGNKSNNPVRDKDNLKLPVEQFIKKCLENPLGFPLSFEVDVGAKRPHPLREHLNNAVHYS